MKRVALGEFAKPSRVCDGLFVDGSRSRIGRATLWRNRLVPQRSGEEAGIVALYVLNRVAIGVEPNRRNPLRLSVSLVDAPPLVNAGLRSGACTRDNLSR